MITAVLMECTEHGTHLQFVSAVEKKVFFVAINS
jgi:hypothetical protein